jgi:hypothetical protein
MAKNQVSCQDYTEQFSAPSSWYSVSFEMWVYNEQIWKVVHSLIDCQWGLADNTRVIILLSISSDCYVPFLSELWCPIILSDY